MDEFDPETAVRLRMDMLASREALKEATRLFGNAHVSAVTSHGSGPSTEQTQAFSRATAEEQRAMAEYLEYLAAMSDQALRRSRRGLF